MGHYYRELMYPDPIPPAKPAAKRPSKTWPFVLAFAKRMESKLAKNRHKGDRRGWLKDDAASLYLRLIEESNGLAVALTNESATPEQIANEAADVANFAMMVADVAMHGRMK